MAPNHKLTNVIKGRKVVGTSNEDGKTIVSFDDGSTLRIKTGASSTGNVPGETTTPASGDAATNAAAHQQNLMPAESRRNDVFRNLRWNEAAFKEDVSRQGVRETVARSGSPVETGAAKVAVNRASTGGTVKSVMQGDTTMTLFFEDGSKMDFPLAEASSSVMLRGKDNTMEYAD